MFLIFKLFSDPVPHLWKLFQDMSTNLNSIGLYQHVSPSDQSEKMFLIVEIGKNVVNLLADRRKHSVCI